jgi:hypothetical protein
MASIDEEAPPRRMTLIVEEAGQVLWRLEKLRL